MAIEAGVPIIPMCVSTTHNKIALNRWKNGVVITDMLQQARQLADHCHQIMETKIRELDEEVAKLEAEQRSPRNQAVFVFEAMCKYQHVFGANINTTPTTDAVLIHDSSVPFF